MPEYLSPGVYVEEYNRGTRPIEGVGTAVAAFIGFAPEGEPNVPTLITNWSQYVEKFGSKGDGSLPNPHMPGMYLSHAVYGFFLNGGGRCYVTRVAAAADGKNAKGAVLQIPARGANSTPLLTISPKLPLAEDVQVEVENKQKENGAEGVFTLRIRVGSDEEEYEVGLGGPGANSVQAVNQKSRLIRLTIEESAEALSDRLPQEGNYTLKASQNLPVAKIQANHFIGDVAERSGVEGMELAEDVTMVCCPDLMSAYQAGAISGDGVKAVQTQMIAHCERMGDRIAILDPLPNLTPQQADRWRSHTNHDSKYASVYYPWIKIIGPEGNPIEVPPCGHIAGIFARSDTERGVHKAPANEIVRGAIAVATPITKGEQDILNPLGVNCIRTFNGRGIRVWGARTLSSDPAWRYINVRRIFNYVEKSIERGTQWVVFEPNDMDLWARVRRDITAFLTGVWRDGMLFGNAPGEAFYVKCDEELNPLDVRDRGQLIIEIGLAPVKPAEFVVFRISQWAGGGA